jgi:hypothetical protein
MIRKKKQIGDHASPQRGFGLITPRGTEEGGEMPCPRGRVATGRTQTAADPPNSQPAVTSRKGIISDRNLNQDTMCSENRAQLCTVVTALHVTTLHSQSGDR